MFKLKVEITLSDPELVALRQRAHPSGVVPATNGALKLYVRQRFAEAMAEEIAKGERAIRARQLIQSGAIEVGGPTV